MPKWNLKKTCRATTVPYSDMWKSPRYFVHIRNMGNPLIADAEIHALRGLSLAEFKNRYVNANIHL